VALIYENAAATHERHTSKTHEWRRIREPVGGEQYDSDLLDTIDLQIKETEESTPTLHRDRGY
jgi:hypothetical protein